MPWFVTVRTTLPEPELVVVLIVFAPVAEYVIEATPEVASVALRVT